MYEMRVDRLERFVGALGEVVRSLPEAREVQMFATYPPACGSPGCHAGLAKLALDRLGVEGAPGPYSFQVEAVRLSWWLLGDPVKPFSDELLSAARRGAVLPNALRDWADANPELWGNGRGKGMFAEPEAFGQASFLFPSSVVWKHWRGVLRRVKAARGAAVGVVA